MVEYNRRGFLSVAFGALGLSRVAMSLCRRKPVYFYNTGKYKLYWSSSLKILSDDSATSGLSAIPEFFGTEIINTPILHNGLTVIMPVDRMAT